MSIVFHKCAILYSSYLRNVIYTLYMVTRIFFQQMPEHIASSTKKRFRDIRAIICLKDLLEALYYKFVYSGKSQWQDSAVKFYRPLSFWLLFQTLFAFSDFLSFYLREK